MNNTTTALTIEEVSERYEVAISTLKKNPSRTFEMIRKKYGVSLRKEGRGGNAVFYIENVDYIDPSRALTLYQSLEKNFIPAKAAASLLDINFLVFIGIITSPQRAFRGSYLDLMKYLELEPNINNVETMRQVLTSLADNNYIIYVEDDTDPLYFLAGVKRKVEKELVLEIETILKFQQYVEGTRKSWIPLMKVYLALFVVQQPCTIKQLSNCTGLTEYKVRDSLSILEKHNVILKKREVVKDHFSECYYCLGTNIGVLAWGW